MTLADLGCWTKGVPQKAHSPEVALTSSWLVAAQDSQFTSVTVVVAALDSKEESWLSKSISRIGPFGVGQSVSAPQ